MTDLDELFGTAVPQSPDDDVDAVQKSGAGGANNRENDGDEWIPPWEEQAAPATPPGKRPAGSAASVDLAGAAGAGSGGSEPVAIPQREVSFVGFDPDAGSAGVPDDNAVRLDDVPPGDRDMEDDPYAFLDEDEEALQQAEARIKRRRTLTRVAALGGLLLLGVVGAGLVIRGLVLRLPAVLGRDEPAIATVVPADAGALRTPEDNKPAPTPTFEVPEEAVNVPVATQEPHLLRVTGDATYGGARPYKILYQIRAVRSDQDGVTVELDCDACLWSGAPQPVTLAQGEERTVAAVLLPPEPAQFTLRANGEVCIVWTVKHSPTISGYDATCVPYVP